MLWIAKKGRIQGLKMPQSDFSLGKNFFRIANGPTKYNLIWYNN